jgi:hypothetical protein
VPDFEAQFHIPPVSTGIGEARRFTRDRLKTWGLLAVADNAILMISELVTNAILHGGEGAVLTLTYDDLKVRAEVRDSSPAMPVVRSYSETATTGRGMVIVDALAAAWGTFAVDGGKVVWFELATGGAGDDVEAREHPVRTKPATEIRTADFRVTTSPDTEQFRPRSRLAPAVSGAWL